MLTCETQAASLEEILWILQRVVWPLSPNLIDHAQKSTRKMRLWFVSHSWITIIWLSPV